VATDDEPGSAPFIVAAVAGMDGLVDISSYWVFSDGALLLSCARVSWNAQQTRTGMHRYVLLRDKWRVVVRGSV
jgi:hypothetical protein